LRGDGSWNEQPRAHMTVALNRASIPELDAPASMCAISSFATSRPMLATKSSLPPHRSVPRRFGPSCSPISGTSKKKGVLAVDARTPSGYIDRGVGLQTDEPFKRAIFPFGGLLMVEAGLMKAAGLEANPQVHEASRNTARPTTMACSTLIHPKS
jgi:hypothetical protein